MTSDLENLLQRSNDLVDSAKRVERADVVVFVLNEARALLNTDGMSAELLTVLATRIGAGEHVRR